MPAVIMLTIRPEQVAILQRDVDSRLASQIVAHFQRHYPRESRAVEEDELRLRVAKSITLARTLRLDSGQAISAFVLLRLTMGPAFHLHPAVHAILTGSATDEARVDRLASDLDAKTWREAASQPGSEW